MNAFDWRGPSELAEHFDAAPKPNSQTGEGMYPQLSYYYRKKAGLSGSRKNPVRGWRVNGKMSQSTER